MSCISVVLFFCIRVNVCDILAAVSLQVLEYKSDLKQYWKRSHGHVISSLSSCPLFHHVFRTLDKAGRPRRFELTYYIVFLLYYQRDFFFTAASSHQVC